MSVQSIRNSNRIIQDSVLYFVKNDFEWLFWLRVETALEYLEKKLYLSESERAIVMQHPLFWGWWLNQWYSRDDKMLMNIQLANGGGYYQTPLANGNFSTSFIDISTPEAFKEFYTAYHMAIRLDVVPESAVMESITNPKNQKLLINQ